MLKKIILLSWVFLTLLAPPTFANVCCPDDPDYDYFICTNFEADPGNVLPTPCGSALATVPIDGGVSIFVGIAAAYGASRLRKKRKKS
jgi:hypothetical protein